MNTVAILKWQGLGLGVMVAGMILSQGLMGFQAIRALFGIGLAKILIKAATVGFLVRAYGVVGLGLSYVVCECAATVILFVSLMYCMKGYIRRSAAPGRMREEIPECGLWNSG
jgi:O-antigen/teichoic acid export membrane protein